VSRQDPEKLYQPYAAELPDLETNVEVDVPDVTAHEVAMDLSKEEFNEGFDKKAMRYQLLTKNKYLYDQGDSLGPGTFTVPIENIDIPPGANSVALCPVATSKPQSSPIQMLTPFCVCLAVNSKHVKDSYPFT
jgi:hypothetical protein